ncbi:MAG: MobB mobilization protein [Cellvibrio sp.]|uniref:plasmid mobilization protein n=1 Tax=Cellvibrio sp. TaxID=1965322 RepID=UPI0027280AEB|nr:MobB mobilization protein [Cellvibrio sp.]
MLDTKVDVRLTSAEKARLQEDAYLAGMSMSALVRARYFGRPIIANTDQVMIRELRRQGGLLNKVHTQSDGAYSAETAAALVLISDAIKSISRASRTK